MSGKEIAITSLIVLITLAIIGSTSLKSTIYSGTVWA